jgi:hypothetical protein
LRGARKHLQYYTLRNTAPHQIGLSPGTKSLTQTAPPPPHAPAVHWGRTPGFLPHRLINRTKARTSIDAHVSETVMCFITCTYLLEPPALGRGSKSRVTSSEFGTLSVAWPAPPTNGAVGVLDCALGVFRHCLLMTA